MSLQRHLTLLLSATTAVALALPLVFVLRTMTQTIWAQMDAEIEGIIVAAGHIFVEEVEFALGIDWDEEADGVHKDRIEGPLLPDDFAVTLAPEYEWLARNPDGSVLGVTSGFPKAHPPLVEHDELTLEDSHLEDGAPARLATTIIYYVDESLEPDIARKLHGPIADRDWRVGARPAFQGFDLHQYPKEVAVARSIEPELASIRRIRWMLALCWLFASLSSIPVVMLAVRRALRPVAEVSEHFAELDGPSLGHPLELGTPVPEEIAPLVEQAESWRERLLGVYEREKRFSADAAHELLSPVAALRATLEVAFLDRRAEGIPEEARRAASQCVDMTISMQSTVEALLELASMEKNGATGMIPGVDLDALIEESLDPLRTRLGARGLRVVTENCKGSAVTTDPILAQRVMGNLLSNAVEYACMGSVIRIEHYAGPGTPSLRVANDFHPQSGHLQAHAMELFWRSSPSHESEVHHAGLGLPLAKACAEALGGGLQIEVEGSRFTATFELAV